MTSEQIEIAAHSGLWSERYAFFEIAYQLAVFNERNHRNDNPLKINATLLLYAEELLEKAESASIAYEEDASMHAVKAFDHLSLIVKKIKSKRRA